MGQRKEKKKRLGRLLNQEFPPRLFLCRTCGRKVTLHWSHYAIGQVVKCHECDGVMHSVRG